jgi:hypothetical protein
MNDYIDENWKAVLAHNGLASFDELWQLEADWFEPPNRRRGGWSGVARCELKRPEGGVCTIFLKRQENHGTPSLRHPLRGIPTYLREFRRIMTYRAADIPTLVPVFFAMRRVGKDDRAILITEALAGYVSLEERVQRWLKEGAPTRKIRLRTLAAIAALLRKMHDSHLQHSCFFPKHVFTRVNEDGSVDVRVIDLEKSRRRMSKTLCAIRDLYSLNAYSACWSTSDKLWFVKAYLQMPRLNFYAKWLWRKIAQRSLTKQRGATRSSILTPREGIFE